MHVPEWKQWYHLSESTFCNHRCDLPREGMATLKTTERWISTGMRSAACRRSSPSRSNWVNFAASALLEKPSGSARAESAYLEVHDGALLLEAARLPGKRVNGHTMRDAYALVASLLLTGGRLREVLGLDVEDVSFDRKTVTFRPNTWRRLKTRRSARTVPLWPQLEEILRPYVFDFERPPGRLLFPSFASGQEAMRTDTRKLLDHVAARAGWKPGEIRAKMFRHTYCAARLQTLDHGAPVSP